MVRVNPEEFLPPRHPRYNEPKTNGARSAEARRLWSLFYDEFKRVHGYKYSGNFYADTAMLDKLLKNSGMTSELVEKMIKVLFDYYDGRWKEKPASVSVLVYDSSRMEIIDYVHRKAY